MIARIGAKLTGKQPPAKKPKIQKVPRTPRETGKPVQLERGKYFVREHYTPTKAYNWKIEVMRPAEFGDRSYQTKRGADDSRIFVKEILADTRLGVSWKVKLFIFADRRRLRRLRKVNPDGSYREYEIR